MANADTAPHAFTARHYFASRDEAERIVMHALEHLRLTTGEDPDADAVLSLASELADEYGVGLASYLLSVGVLTVASEYEYLRQREREIFAFKSLAIEALIRQQHGITAD